jgi:hypothetical protein
MEKRNIGVILLILGFVLVSTTLVTAHPSAVQTISVNTQIDASQVYSAWSLPSWGDVGGWIGDNAGNLGAVIGGSLMIAGGYLITGLSFGLAAPLGGAISGAGTSLLISGATHMATGTHITWEEALGEMAVGAAIGAVTAGLGAWALRAGKTGTEAVRGAYVLAKSKSAVESLGAAKAALEGTRHLYLVKYLKPLLYGAAAVSSIGLALTYTTGGGGTPDLPGTGALAVIGYPDFYNISTNILNDTCSEATMVDVGGGEKLYAGVCFMDVNRTNRLIAAEGGWISDQPIGTTYSVIINVSSSTYDCYIDTTKMSPSGKIIPQYKEGVTGISEEKAVSARLLRPGYAYFVTFKSVGGTFELYTMPLPTGIAISEGSTSGLPTCWSDVQEMNVGIATANDGKCPEGKTSVSGYCCPAGLTSYKAGDRQCCAEGMSYSEITLGTSTYGACCNSSTPKLTQVKYGTAVTAMCCPDPSTLTDINSGGTTVQYCCKQGVTAAYESKTVKDKDNKDVVVPVGIDVVDGKPQKSSTEQGKLVCCEGTIQDWQDIKICVKKS